MCFDVFWCVLMCFDRSVLMCFDVDHVHHVKPLLKPLSIRFTNARFKNLMRKFYSKRSVCSINLSKCHNFKKPNNDCVCFFRFGF